MRELDQARADFLMRINTPEYREEARKNEEAHLAAMADAEAKLESYRVKFEAQESARAAAVIPLKEALHAAGIKLEFHGYCDGAWLRYQIGNGPIVEVDYGPLDAFEED